MFNIKSQRFFNVENIYYSLSKDIRSFTQKNKWDEISNIFNKYIKQKSYSKNDVIFGVPIIDTSHDNIRKK